MRSEKESNVTVSIGPSLCGMLGVAFIVLKLCGVIDWPWWAVTLPLWGPVALVLLLLAVILALGILAYLFGR